MARHGVELLSLLLNFKRGVWQLSLSREEDSSYERSKVTHPSFTLEKGEQYIFF
jgi:hypothetical protein